MNLVLFNAEYLPLLIVLGVMIIPIFSLLLVVLIKFIYKNFKRNKSSKQKFKSDEKEKIINKYLKPFGQDNIISIEAKMRRVNVEVKDVTRIDIEGLKKLGVGVLIVGNIIKCSSEEFANAVEKNE